MAKKQHKVLDRPIIGYLICTAFGFIMSQAGSVGDTILAYILPGYGQMVDAGGIKVAIASGVGVAAASILAVIGFYLFFKPEFKGMMKVRQIPRGLLLLLPFLLVHWAGSVVSWIEWGTVGSLYTVFIVFLRAFAPGFGEEITYRGLGIANYMRSCRSEDKIMPIFWMSSVVFGLIHITNVFSGAPLLISIIQAIYATGVGMVFGAVYLRTGSLWPTIIGHLLVDFMEFIRSDLGSSGGVMTQMGIGDWITIGAGILAAVLGIILVSKKYRPAILEVWREKWPD